MQLGAYIEQEGLTWAQFARRSGVSKQNLSRIKLGQGGVTLETAGAIHDATCGIVSYPDLRTGATSPCP